jgi:hypothetical protein
MSGVANVARYTKEDDYYQQPEDDGSLHHWMMCEDDPDICPKCGKQGGEYTPTLDECAFC